MEIVKLLILDVELAFRHKKLLLEKANQSQIDKALKYKNETDQIRSLASSYLINKLSKEPLLFNDMGKPFFENGPYFNVSHSGRYIVMAVSTKEIGVDIEENVEKNMSSLIRIFNETEAKMVKEHADFYYMWCAKESLIKCIGGSISKIKEIPSLPLNGIKTFKGHDYQCQAFVYDKHIVSITRESKEEFEVKIERINQLS